MESNGYKITIDMQKGIDINFVSKLLADTYFIDRPRYMPHWFIRPTYKSLPFTDVEMDTPVPDYDKAPVRFGQKTFGAFWLKDDKYNAWEIDGTVKEVRLGDFLMPLATLVDFARPKTVTKTPTLGGYGTVKEIYGLGDWTVSIKGIIIPDPDNKPAFRTVEGQMDAIQKYHEIAGSINVEGQLFAQRNISRIVTENLTFTPVQGFPNMMQYSIDAVSDEDLFLSL